MVLSLPDLSDAEGVGLYFASRLVGSATTVTKPTGVQVPGHTFVIRPGDEVKILEVRPHPKHPDLIDISVREFVFSLNGEQVFQYFCVVGGEDAEGEQPDHGGH